MDTQELKFMAPYNTKHGVGLLIGRSPDGDLLMSFAVYDGIEKKPCANLFVRPEEVIGPAERKKK